MLRTRGTDCGASAEAFADLWEVSKVLAPPFAFKRLTFAVVGVSKAPFRFVVDPFTEPRARGKGVFGANSSNLEPINSAKV